MRKLTVLILALVMALTLAACGGGTPAQEPTQAPTEASTQAPAPTEAPTEAPDRGWSREGYFQDEEENFLSVTYMEDVDPAPGWYVGLMIGEDPMEDSYGGMLQLEGDTLRGQLSSGGSKGELTVTLSPEGEDGVAVAVEGGQTYHFTEMDIPEATIFVSVNTDGSGSVSYAEGETTPEFDPEYPYQSAQINLAEPTTYTLLATSYKPGWQFVKWTKDGQDYATDPQITVNLDKTADFIAVFAQDPNWVNPLAVLEGQYQSDRAGAQVTVVDETVFVTVEWGGSASSVARWLMVGEVDAEDMTLRYENCSMSNVTYGENGDVVGETSAYDDGTGTVVFAADGSTFTWHDDMEPREDMVFTRTEEAQ